MSQTTTAHPSFVTHGRRGNRQYDPFGQRPSKCYYLRYMSFVAQEREWVHSHYFSVPEQIVEFCGDIRGKSILDVGCGDMLGTFGILPLGVQRVTGLDLAGKRTVDLSRVCQRIMQQDIPVPANYAELLRYVEYDGLRFPFEDETFDVVISWSAFEHITNVPQVLREIKRVCRRTGLVFIQVYPWYHCLQGSHLTDYISEPYFHLNRPPEWVWQRLNDYVDKHPEERAFVFENMWPEYQTLNRYSANRFYADVIAAGFTVRKSVAITFPQDFTEAPRDIPLADLTIFGTKMLLLPYLSDRVDENNFKNIEPREMLELRTALSARDLQIAELKDSWSWKITAPLRALGSMFTRRS